MRASRPAFLAAVLWAAGCEDGPEQVFEPNTGDPVAQNGFAPTRPFTPPGSKGFGEEASGDSAGRARICDEAESTELVQRMVVEPVIPDVSVGGVPLWGPDGKPLHADDLVGRPEDGKFCDPTSVYLDAFTWGPTNEVIVFFNQETRLVEGVMAYQQYLGALEGSFTDDRGRSVRVVVKPRERVVIGERELDQYTSRADQASKPNAWLNNANVTSIYKMLRETFFGAAPFPADFDCVASKVCDLIYTSSNESTPQDTFIDVRDSGIQVRFSPEGQAYFVYVEPLRIAPFEGRGEIDFGPAGSSTMAFSFTSQTRASCTISVDRDLTFGAFKSLCVDEGDTRTLSRVSYDVEAQRDAVQVSFNGIDLGFLRRTSEKGVLRDGQAPDDDDRLYSFSFTRSLEAPVEEFRPRTIGNVYKRKLEERLRSAIIASGATTPPEQHPLALFQVRVPFFVDNEQRIGELLTPRGDSWVPGVVAEVVEMYDSLTLEEQAMADPRVLEPVFLVEPFVDAVLEVFSHGESNRPGAFKVFQTTDDRRWSIGDLHFLRSGEPYRLQVQYSLDFGAVTAVFVERGYSEVDEIFERLSSRLGDGSPYYEIELALLGAANPYGLGGTGIVVNSFDRRLETLSVELQMPLLDGTFTSLDLVVPGDPIQDRSGYLRQIRGERFEFVPADVVRLYGKETLLAFYVEADGAIGRVDQFTFKGEVELCPGLAIRYGDDVRRIVEAWAETSGSNAHRNCEIAFNYSANGNVLDSVVSLSNRVRFVVVDGRAVTASVWR